MTTKLVGLFHNVKVTSLKIHAEGCSMLRIKGRKQSIVPVDAETVVDLNERGLGVAYCKCCPKDAVAALKAEVAVL